MPDMNSGVDQEQLLSDVPDRVLSDAARAGELSAFQELYVRHRDVALRVARRAVRLGDADDLVSESFAAVFAAMRNGYGPKDNFRAYLLSSMRRMAGSWSRADGKVASVGFASDLDMFSREFPEQSPESRLVERETHRTVREAFSALEPKDRMFLWCVDVEGLSHAETARRTGIPAGSVNSALAKARRALRQAYAGIQVVDVDGIPLETSSIRGAHLTPRKISSYLNHRLPKVRVPAVEQHLETCPSCRLLLEEETERGSSLRGPILGGMLAPLVAPFPSETRARLRTSRRRRPLWFGVAAMLFLALVVGAFALTRGSTDSPAPSASARTASGAPSSTSSANLNGVHAQWDPAATVDGLAVGETRALRFEVNADEGIEAPVGLALEFTLGPGIVLAQNYPECDTSTDVITCPMLAPLTSGEAFGGTLTVKRTSEDGRMPGIGLVTH